MATLIQPSASVTRPLPEGYYLDNFEVMLKTVAEYDNDLLRSEEQDFLETFRSLSEGARRLYVRLLSRKGPVFRLDKLAYHEVPSIKGAVAELSSAGFTYQGPDTGVDELVCLLLRSEVVAIVKKLMPEGTSLRGRKDRLLALLIEAVGVDELRRAVLGHFQPVQLRRLEQVNVFRLLFFGNLSQDWTEFVLRDIGVVHYETYELRRDLRRFPSRQAVDDYLLLRQARYEIQRYLEAGEDEQAVDQARALLEHAEGWHPSARRLADRMFNDIGRHLERCKQPRAALAFYQSAVAPPARERRARILAHLGSVAQALALCEEIREDPHDETEAIFARKFSHRLRRMRGEPLRAPAPRPRPQRHLELERIEGVTVEKGALDALAAAGQLGFFAENWLWKSLFGLAFWDVVFAPVAGAFQHPFQLGPLDLSSPSFRAARSAAVERRLEELRADPEPGPRLLRRYDEKEGVANRLVSWHEGLRGHLELALTRLTGRHLCHVFERLSRDLWRYRRGLPDLFVLRDEAPGFELLEVKSPTDQLRPEQRAWIDYLNEGSIPTSILMIRWQA